MFHVTKRNVHDKSHYFFLKYWLNHIVSSHDWSPFLLTHMNTRIKDEEASYLQQYWDDTYNFIKDAKRQNKKVFVHCRMGVSRSASCVSEPRQSDYSHWALLLNLARHFVWLPRLILFVYPWCKTFNPRHLGPHSSKYKKYLPLER